MPVMNATTDRTANVLLRFGYTDFFLFLLPFGKLFQFSLIGRLYGVDFCLIAAVILLCRTRSGIFRDCRVLAFVAMLLLWFLGIVASDIYRGSAFEDWTRGWSKILLFGVSFVGLALLIERRLDRLIVFTAGLAFATLAETVVVPNEFFAEYPWKFGYATPLTIIAILIAEADWFVARFGRFAGVLGVYAIAGVSFALNSRSAFGMAAAAATFGLLKLVLDPGQRGLRMSNLRFACFLAGGIVIAWGLVEAQGWAAGSGFLGRDAQDKYLLQATGDLGILLGGRVESLVSTQAILDSPILGHGSWARDISYVGLLLDTLVVNGLNPNPDTILSDDLIPSHSYLSGAWVEAGVLGGVFWMWIFWQALVAFRASFALATRKNIFIAFTLFSLLWDILFSPFGADRRFVVPVPILLAMWVVGREREQRRANAEQATLRTVPVWMASSKAQNPAGAREHASPAQLSATTSRLRRGRAGLPE